jgi:6-phosphogluconolactonase (cycloisomerase 2 family)
VDTLQPVAGCTLTNPCPGAVAGYAIQPTKSANDPGALGVGPSGCSSTPSSSQTLCTNGNAVINGNGLTYVPLQLSALDTTVLTPTAIAITASGSYAYVSAYNPANNQGYIFAFSIGTDGGLTAVPSGATYQFNGASTALIPLAAGSEPSALATDTSGAYLYVVDKLRNQVAVYTVQSGGTLALASTAPTGGQPSAITLASGFLYVANSLDGTVNGYSVSGTTLTSFGTYDAGTQPVAVIGDPRKLGFLYTVNFLGNSLSGFQVNPATGALVNTKASPYVSSVQPTAIVGIPHDGNAH